MTHSLDRSTLVPAFDVQQLARDSDRWEPVREAFDSQTRISPPPVANDSSVHLRAADIYWARIGRADLVPRLTVPAEAINPDERAECAGFILFRVDGVRTVREIIEDSTLPELTALALLCSLADAGLIEIGD